MGDYIHGVKYHKVKKYSSKVQCESTHLPGRRFTTFS